MTFWEHLDVLRGSLIRIAVALFVAAGVAFYWKEALFSVVLAPCRADFFLYRWMGLEPMDIQLVNVALTEQFMTHMKVALTVGFLAASPYILYILFRFVSPALYENERRHSVGIVLWAYLLFMTGVAVNYLLVFPLTARFLGNYQVDESVANMFTITSYIDTLTAMSLVFGILFELPVLAWLLARFGLLHARWMTRYRRHAVVAILIVAAIITPTGDPLTLLLVSLPIWLLYELSVGIVASTEKSRNSQ